MRHVRRGLVALGLGASLIVAGYLAWPALPGDRQSPPPPPDRLLFVPIGDFPEDWLDDLVSRYQPTLERRIEVLPPMPIDSSLVDPARRQLVAEKVVMLIMDTYPPAADDPRVAIIGLTTQDMYIQEFSWRFAFAFRVDDRIAVVSSARMDPVFYGEPPDRALLETRFRKMLTKNIGHVYHHRPLSRDPRNVMYGRIMGLEELDYIREEPEATPGDVRALLGEPGDRAAPGGARTAAAAWASGCRSGRTPDPPSRGSRGATCPRR